MMSNTNTLMPLFRRALSNIQTPVLSFRCFCSQSSSSSSSAPSSSPSAPNNKLFVAGSFLFRYPVTQMLPQHDSNGFCIEFDLVFFLPLPGLSWSLDERSLKDAFSSYGEVTEGNREC